MEMDEFERAIEKQDFAIGDSFWLNDVEFEVINKRVCGVGVIFTKKSRNHEKENDMS